MPNLPSSRKALRKSIKRRATNARLLAKIRQLFKSRSLDLTAAQSLLDKAAKRSVIKPNKAARLKSQFSRTPK